MQAPGRLGSFDIPRPRDRESPISNSQSPIAPTLRKARKIRPCRTLGEQFPPSEIERNTGSANHDPRFLTSIQTSTSWFYKYQTSARPSRKKGRVLWGGSGRMGNSLPMLIVLSRRAPRALRETRLNLGDLRVFARGMTLLFAKAYRLESDYEERISSYCERVVKAGLRPEPDRYARRDAETRRTPSRPRPLIPSASARNLIFLLNADLAAEDAEDAEKIVNHQ